METASGYKERMQAELHAELIGRGVDPVRAQHEVAATSHRLSVEMLVGGPELRVDGIVGFVGRRAVTALAEDVTRTVRAEAFGPDPFGLLVGRLCAGGLDEAEAKRCAAGRCSRDPDTGRIRATAAPGDVRVGRDPADDLPLRAAAFHILEEARRAHTRTRMAEDPEAVAAHAAAVERPGFGSAVAYDSL